MIRGLQISEDFLKTIENVILDENKYRKPVLVFFIYHALGRWRTFCISLRKTLIDNI